MQSPPQPQPGLPGLGGTQPTTKGKKGRQRAASGPEERPRYHPEFQGSLKAFHAAFVAARGAPPKWGGRERSALERHLRESGSAGTAAEVAARAARMFEMAPAYPVNTGGDLATLIRHWDVFVDEPMGGPFRAKTQDYRADAAVGAGAFGDNPWRDDDNG